MPSASDNPARRRLESMEDIEFTKALVFCPHPDDAEFALGGSLAKWTSEGKECIVCVVTNGAGGSNDPKADRDWLITTREEEQRKAAAITGVSEVIFLGYEDDYVEDSHELRRDMIREIRRHKPDLVIGPDPTTWYFADRYINHPDHRKVGEAFLAAAYPGSETLPIYREELYDKGFEPHKPSNVLLSFSTQPDYFVDISDHISQKIEAILAHTSQMENMDATERVPNQVKELGRFIAGAGGIEGDFAEGFKAFRFRKPQD